MNVRVIDTRGTKCTMVCRYRKVEGRIRVTTEKGTVIEEVSQER